MGSKEDIERALQLYYSGDVAHSESLCLEIIQADPDHPVALHVLGLIAQNSGRIQDSVHFLSRAVEIQPDDPSALINLGNAYLEMGVFDKGIECFTRSFHLTSDSLVADFNFGVAYMKTGRLNEAVSSFKKVLQVNPGHGEALNYLSTVLLDIDDPGDCVMTFGDGVKIRLPDTLQQLTPYVIREQRRWFESEIAFISNFIKPGMDLIDIGANYGVYTLSMAKELEGKGNIWAFEPTGRTADCLESSVGENDYATVEVIRSAISDTQGMAKLSVSNYAETNNITEKPEGVFEEVPVTTLDDCMRHYGWKGIDFLKLDAEGCEVNIIKGGERFFRELSPLVMFEAVDKGINNWHIVDAFIDIGYDLYSHVPALGILVPFVEDGTGLPLELNLFCCKEDTADSLERANLLVALQRLRAEQTEFPVVTGWQKNMQCLPVYRSAFGEAPLEEVISEKDEGKSYLEALRLFFTAETKSLPAVSRYLALRESLAILLTLTEGETASAPRLLTLARVYNTLGDRWKLMDIIERLLTHHEQSGEFSIDEPFVPVHMDFDGEGPVDMTAISSWIYAQLLDQKISKLHYSTFFTGTAVLNDLKLLEATGFMREEMKRRQNMIIERYDLT